LVEFSLLLTDKIVWETQPSKGINEFSVTPPNFKDWVEHQRSFENMAVFRSLPAILTGQSIPERTEMRVTFVMSPVNGKWLSVTATDLSGLTAFAQVEYSPGFLGRLPTINAERM